MKRTSIYIISIFVITGFIAVGFVLKFSNNTPSQNGSANTNIQTARTVRLQDFCRCQAVLKTQAGLRVVDLETQTAKTLPISLLALESGSFSPSHQLAVVRAANSGVDLIDVLSGSTRELYQSTDNEVATNFVWSSDGQFVVFGLRTKGQAGSESQTIVSISVVDKSLQTLLRVSAVSSNGIVSVDPVAISSDRNIVIFSDGVTVDAKEYSWNVREHSLKELPEQPVRAIYLAQTASEPSLLLWLLDSLHSLNLKSLATHSYPIITWSDEPVSQPNPQGKAVMFLQPDDGQQFGRLALLDLESGSKSVFTETNIINPSGLIHSQWTPDGQWFIYQPDYERQDLIMAVEVSKNTQAPRVVSDPVLNSGELLFLIPGTNQ